MSVQLPEATTSAWPPGTTAPVQSRQTTAPAQLTKTKTKTVGRRYRLRPHAMELSRIRPLAGNKQDRRSEPGGRLSWRHGASLELR
jgi:hypothetical protein